MLRYLAIIGVLACGTKDEPARHERPPVPVPIPPTLLGITGEIVHRLDLEISRPFTRHNYQGLAVGGGWVYWLDTPRRDWLHRVIFRKRVTDVTAAPEPVSKPEVEWAMAADASDLYIVGNGLWAASHASGGRRQLLPEGKQSISDVYVGRTHVLVGNSEQLTLVHKQQPRLEREQWPIADWLRHVAVDGDRFLVIEPGALDDSAPWPIKIFESGHAPRILFAGPEVRKHLVVHGSHVYFVGSVSNGHSMPLWRIDKERGGKPELVGDWTWRFADFVIRNETLYGSLDTGQQWRFVKLALSPGAKPTVLDKFDGHDGPAHAVTVDDRHVYYLTDTDVRRVPL